MPQSQSSGLFNTTQPNLFINGNFDIVQGAAGTIIAGTALPTASLGYAPMQTGWFNYSVGGNPTVAQVAGSGTTLNRLQFTGLAGITAIGVGQRIESINAAQLAGQQAALSVDLANSLGLTVTWVAFHPSATADTFGTIVSPTKTQIATGTFTVTSTLTRFSASFACPENIRRGLEIIFTVGAQTSGTWTIGDAKIEVGATATAFVDPDAATELVKCLRTYEVLRAHLRGHTSNSGQALAIIQQFVVRKRSIPVITYISEQEAINVFAVSFNAIQVEGFRFLALSTATGEVVSSQTYSINSQIP